MATALQVAVPRLDTDVEEFLLKDQDQEANNPDDVCRAKIGTGGSNKSVSWITWLGLCMLTFNSGMAIVLSQGDVTAIALVGFSYTDLLALFTCLRMYERAPAGSSFRGWLKIAVWTLTMLRTFAFFYKVVTILPLMAAVLVWLMAFSAVARGFNAFFVCKEE